jgi:methionyl-tRNA formyltransferase
MKVVIITTPEEMYHRHLCAEIARRHRVVAVLHPRPRSGARTTRLELMRRLMRALGAPRDLLQGLARRALTWNGWDATADLAEASRRLIPGAGVAYERYAAPVAREVDDINSADGVRLLASLEPDVVVCSGGPIYRPPLIEAARLMLNFHTGISPIYNGAFTVYWTFANRQPHLTGGTLMLMSPVVDGGDVLGHYLPVVEPGDTPGIQFVKSIMGGTAMYNRFLDDLAAGKPYIALPQGRSFRRYLIEEWTPFQPLAIRRYIADDLCRRFACPERIHDYWRLPDRDAAERELRATLLRLVYDP